MANELIDAAVEYASRNWRVIALHCLNQYDGTQGCSCRKKVDCAAAGKHPMFSKWREIATTDTDKLRAWWRRWPRANVGLLMGGAAALVCVDIDGDEGRESLKKLETEHGKLPKTRSQTTGRAGGGEHFLFHVDPFYVDWIKNRARVAPGLDFRSEGGLIVAAPSLHASGNYYRWRDPNYPIAELPEWMFKVALAHREVSREVISSGERPTEESLAAIGWPLERRLKAAADALRLAEPAIQGQNGSAACYRAAILTARGYCVPVEPHNHVFDLMWSTYNPICQPAWNQDELIHKIHDAEKVSIAPWGFKLNVVILMDQYTQPTPTKITPVGTTSKSAKPSPEKLSPEETQARMRAHQVWMPVQTDARRAPPLPNVAASRATSWREPAPVPQVVVEDDEDEGDRECG